MEKNLGMLIMIGIVLLIAIYMTRNEPIRLEPDCNIQPENENCKCYGTLAKVETNNVFDCIEPECYPSTELEDCNSLADEGAISVPIQCIGEWQCLKHKCAWTCTK